MLFPAVDSFQLKQLLQTLLIPPVRYILNNTFTTSVMIFILKKQLINIFDDDSKNGLVSFCIPYDGLVPNIF